MPAETIRERLKLLDQYARDLREAQPQNFDAFEQDKMLRRYSERMLHMAIDICIQIGIDILTVEGLRNPENYHDVFLLLGDHGIIPAELVRCMTVMVEFRNLLVYEHAAVDHMMVYGFLKRRLDDFDEFANAIREYLTTPLRFGMNLPTQDRLP